MNNIEEKIDAASDSYGNARIKEALRLDRDATVYEKRIQKFDAYDLATTFEQGANFALSNQWISVEEELPENDEDVLVALENGPMQPFMTVAWYSKADNGERRWYSNNDNSDLDLIRFWMPIPPLPKTREEAGE